MKYIITIGREHGSGGREIGYKLAEEFVLLFDLKVANIIAPTIVKKIKAPYTTY